MTILCGHSIRACEYFRDKHHMDRSKTRIATKPEDLYGYIHGTLLIMVGDWRLNEDSREVFKRGQMIDLMVVGEL